MTHDQLPTAAAPAVIGAGQTATPAPAASPDDDGFPDFASDAEAEAYWRGIEVGLRTVGRQPPAAEFPHRAVPAAAFGTDIDTDTCPLPADTAPTPRHDGWTPDRLRRFLTALADCGVVADAARAAGMSAQGAYALRRRKGGAAFRLAWDAAIHHARTALSDELLPRAMKGSTETLTKDGEIVVERHRHDNRLAMSILTRLDRYADHWGDHAKTVRAAADEFDGLLDALAEGPEAAAAFAAACAPAPQSGPSPGRAAPNPASATGGSLLDDSALMARIAGLTRCNGVDPADIDTSDLDPAERDRWTDDQWERADKSGLLDEMIDAEDDDEGDDEEDEGAD